MALITLTIIIIGFILFSFYLLGIIVRNLFFRKINLNDFLVELAYEFGKRVNDKAITGVIEEARKLRSENPDLLPLSSVWVDLINYMREVQSKEAQLVFFQFIFKAAKFPNSEKLAAYLVEIINISWFNPPTKPDQKTLEALANNCIKEFNLHNINQDGGARNYKIESAKFLEETWEKALSEDRNTVLSAGSYKSENIKRITQKSGRDKYLKAVKDIIFGVIWSANPDGVSSDNRYLDSALKVTEQLAELIILEDLIKEGKNNILSYFIELYKLGVWPIGVVEQVNNKINVDYKFVVFIPPTVKTKKGSDEAPFFFMKVWQVNKQMTKALGGDIKGHASRFKQFVRPN